MSKRGLSYLKLWSVDSHLEDSLWPKLEAYLIASARYIDSIYVDSINAKSLNLPHRMSVREAIDVLSASLGMTAVDISTPLRGLPIIARSHRSQALVLLLPKGPDYFIVYDFTKTKSALIKSSTVHKKFSECVQLMRSDLTPVINAELRSYFPQYIIIIASVFKIIMLVLSASLGLMLLQEDFFYNRPIIFIFSLVTLSLSVFVHMFIIKISEQNLSLVFLWARSQLYFRIFSLDLERYLQSSWARVQRVLQGLSIELRKYFLDTPELILTYSFLVFNLFFIFWFNKKFLFLYIFILVIIYLCCRVLAKHMHNLRYNSVLSDDRLEEALAAFKLSFAMAVGLKVQGFLVSRIEDLSRELRNYSYKIARVRAWTQIASLGLALMFLGLLSFEAASWSIGFVAAWIINTLMLSYAFNQLMLFALLPKPRPLSSPILDDLASWSPKIFERVQPVNIQGSIELHDVSFSYPKSSILVIKNANLSFEAKKFYVLLGPSGSGKSTLLKLLMAQEIAQEGHVVFDGQDVRSLEPALLAQHFGAIRQESSLFAGSIRANILCGRDIPTRDLEHLLYSHEIFDLLLDLPMGLETYVFERASNISRLQLVTLLLARALVHKPKILFMDEIFKGLNLDQQALIADYLSSLDITRILVTHDLALLKPDYIIKTPYNAP